jgi:hypothetical protein
MEKDNKLVDPNANNEKLIHENQQLYIKLNEEEGADVTERFFNFAGGKN